MSQISKEVLNSIFNGESSIMDIDFTPLVWEDKFLIELLKWYEKRVRTIYKKEPSYRNKSYYEQFARVLYWAVVVKYIDDDNDLINVFEYFFGSGEYNIDATKLIYLYRSIVKKIGPQDYKHKDHDVIGLFTDKWASWQKAKLFNNLWFKTTISDYYYNCIPIFPGSEERKKYCIDCDI
ncbi:MAG: hypothetical protein IJ997_03920 [Mycoplasmataceae bacterium]|nr:hypothetical protein [Mycoplasmataceae bacterium]